MLLANTERFRLDRERDGDRYCWVVADMRTGENWVWYTEEAARRDYGRRTFIEPPKAKPKDIPREVLYLRFDAIFWANFGGREEAVALDAGASARFETYTKSQVVLRLEIGKETGLVVQTWSQLKSNWETQRDIERRLGKGRKEREQRNAKANECSDHETAGAGADAAGFDY